MVECWVLVPTLLPFFNIYLFTMGYNSLASKPISLSIFSLFIASFANWSTISLPIRPTWAGMLRRQSAARCRGALITQLAATNASSYIHHTLNDVQSY